MPENLRWGVATGLAFAAVYAAFVTVLSFLNGSPMFDRYGVHLGQIIGAYAAAGSAIGLLVGFLRPFASTPIAWVLIGAMSGPLLYGAVGMTMDGASWDTLKTAFILGVPMGLLSGLWLWRLDRE